MKNLVFMICSFVLLAGCAEATITDNHGSHTIHYAHEWAYSPGLAKTKLNDAANKACPSGNWKQLEEKHLSAGQYGTTQWEIECLD